MNYIAFWVAVVLQLVPVVASAEDYFALVVTGASGQAKYVQDYSRWRHMLVSSLRSQAEFRDEHLVVLAETPAPGIGKASRDGVVAAVAKLRQRMNKDSVLLVVLIGHGTYDGVDAKFNLVGPDFSAADWDRLLDSLPGRLVFVNTTASSFPFVNRLSQEDRVVITATGSAVQRFDTRFPDAFVKMFDDPEADTSKDGRVSVWEAFAATSAQVRRWYQQEGRLVTERAVLDDSGDGVGADAEHPGGDGQVAARLHVGAGVERPMVVTDSFLAPLILQRDKIEDQVAGLIARKSSVNPEAYWRELERLLIDLARVSHEIRHQTSPAER